MAVIRTDEEYSPESLERSIPSPIFTPLMNVSILESWETTHTTAEDNTFNSEDEPRRVCMVSSPSETIDSNGSRHGSIASSPSSTQPPPRRQKRKLSMGMSFTKNGECRSTPASNAASTYQPKKHPNALEKLKYYTLLIKL